ncbi:sugar phosphate isomerase/epimerase family protein [Singulisphaera sp. PoT]|uniref:sugar phosphate isomerase/epimerase family protein n=1 Tax=Singulisphaera sp. PoT TaxID=3411797 RepID=UPI003BF4C9BC
MIRTPLGLRLNPARPIREQIREAAKLGAKGVVIDAIGDLGPDRLSETGRRELRHLLRSVELTLIGLHLPTRRPFDNLDQLDDRLLRAENAFTLAYELGTRLAMARVGPLPAETETTRRETWLSAVAELGRRADHRGIRLGIESGTEPGKDLRTILDGINSVGLGVSIDPGTFLMHGHDPIAAVRDLDTWVVHAYGTDASSIGTARTTSMANPFGTGFRPGVLDWEEYLGSLEEVGYQGYLTIWPDPARDPGPQFTSLRDHLARF